MESSMLNLVVSLTGAGVVGLIAWVWALWLRHHDLDKKVAEFYSKKTDLDDIKRDIRDIRDLVHRLCLKLDVPTVTDAYR